MLDNKGRLHFTLLSLFVCLKNHVLFTLLNSVRVIHP